MDWNPGKSWDNVVASGEELKAAIAEFETAKDWMLLEGEDTAVQCLVCLKDQDLANDYCERCGTKFEGLKEHRS